MQRLLVTLHFLLFFLDQSQEEERATKNSKKIL